MDLLVMGLNEMRLLDAYDAVLEALADFKLPVQPLVARQALLVKHGDASFWRSVKAEAISAAGGVPIPMSQEGTGMAGSRKPNDKPEGEELPTEWDVGNRHAQPIRPVDFIHLRGVEAGLQEWNTPEDEEAFADL